MIKLKNVSTSSYLQQFANSVTNPTLQAQSINNDLHIDKQLCRMPTPFTAFTLHLDIQINNDC